MATSCAGWLQPPLTARNGRVLMVLMVCRVSDPTKQDERSPEDQEAALREWLDAHTDLPYEVTPVAGPGSGERLERAEYLRLLDLIESEQYDVVMTEDLGRIVRRIHAHLVCEQCVDHSTRLISPFVDQVDTAVEGWQDRSIFAAWHHERSNRDTSHRIKRTHRARFSHGGCLYLPIFGYRNKPGVITKAKKRTDDDLEKVPEAEPIYKEWFDRLDHGALYAEIADWLNETNVRPGPYAHGDKWTGTMVARVTHNSLLKGVRFRNKRKSKRNNTTGKYVCEKAAPSELLIRSVPHLAFFDEAYYDRVVAKADARNKKYRRTGNGGHDPCANRPKKRVRFPGQSVFCGICGRLYVFGAHGQKDRLMCSGARLHLCWNGAAFDGGLAAHRISEAVFSQIASLPDFDPAFLDMVNEDARQWDSAQQVRLQEIAGKIQHREREIANLMKFIRGGDDSASVREELQRLEKQLQLWRCTKKEIEDTPSRTLVLPTADETKQVARQAFRDLAADSYEFAKILRQVTGPILVWPFQSVDGGPIVLRAKLQLQIASLLPDSRLRAALERPLNRLLRIDLFEPPQPVVFRERVVAGRNELGASGRRKTERAVADELGITVAAAQRAAALDRLMTQQGLVDPYVLLKQPPPDDGKFCRHHHPRYCFTPLPDHDAEW